MQMEYDVLLRRMTYNLPASHSSAVPEQQKHATREEGPSTRDAGQDPSTLVASSRRTPRGQRVAGRGRRADALLLVRCKARALFFSLVCAGKRRSCSGTYKHHACLAFWRRPTQAGRPIGGSRDGAGRPARRAGLSSQAVFARALLCPMCSAAAGRFSVERVRSPTAIAVACQHPPSCEGYDYVGSRASMW